MDHGPSHQVELHFATIWQPRCAKQTYYHLWA
jgi:hypothetical protein